MAAAYPLSSDDEPDENLGYIEFYQSHLQWLRTVPLDQLKEDVKSDISVLFWLTSSREEWMVCLNELGLNHIAIGKIAYASNVWGITPLHVFFNSDLHHSIYFGHIVEYCLKKEKFHILRHVKPFIEEEDLLEKSQESPEPSAPGLESTTEFGFPFVSSFPSHSKQDSARKKKVKKKKENGNFRNESNFSTFSSSHMPSFLLEMEQPSTSVITEHISVFILHPLAKVKYAKKLARILKEYQIRVFLSSDIFRFLRFNHSMILTALNKKVDFIIPFVCDELLKQIHSKVDKVRKQEDVENIANRFLYTLLKNEYSSNMCCNYRVLPVYRASKILDNVKYDPILSWCYKLWDEIPRLIEDLEDTKNNYNIHFNV